LFHIHAVAETQLFALDSGETSAFIDYRLGDDPIVFSAEIKDEVFRLTSGRPEDILRLCRETIIQTRVAGMVSVSLATLTVSHEKIQQLSRLPVRKSMRSSASRPVTHKPIESPEVEILSQRLEDLESVINDLKEDVREDGDFLRKMIGMQMDIDDDDL